MITTHIIAQLLYYKLLRNLLIHILKTNFKSRSYINLRKIRSIIVIKLNKLYSNIKYNIIKSMKYNYYKIELFSYLININ